MTCRMTALYTPSVNPPIGPYVRLPPTVEPWDPRTIEVAAAVTELIRERRPDLTVEHIGSTAVPGLPGKGIVDLAAGRRGIAPRARVRTTTRTRSVAA